ncbi:hypothetical protein Lepto7376_3185 [[Leptolyngbya] sp. PCC 7376]|nr:hypothetical protein Lepto7376_3185 [[Leptolyngbya] sp. PCC 7376]
MSMLKLDDQTTLTKNLLKTSRIYRELYGLGGILFVRIGTVICDRPDGLLPQLPLSKS